ncbi:MAG: GHKL domain-containing protein [Clostridiales bacterium]|nr:GHKL domain-containing protein [Clostridiales bacterium]
METAILNGIYFSVEFLKILLAVTIFFKCRMKKYIGIISVVAIIAVTVAAVWIDLIALGWFFPVISIAIIGTAAYKKRAIFFSIVSFIGISFVDLVFEVTILNIFPGADLDELMQPIAAIGINSISLFLLMIAFLVLQRKKTPEIDFSWIHSMYLLLFLIAGFSFSASISIIQVAPLGGDSDVSAKHGQLPLLLVMLLLFSIFLLILYNYGERERMQREDLLYGRLFEEQYRHYQERLKKEDETRAFRHDMHAHLIDMDMLIREKRYDELSEYVQQLDDSVHALSPISKTGNPYIDLVFADLCEIFPDVKIEWNGKMPPLSMKAMDVCTLSYNLLSNAFEAAHGADEPYVSVTVRTREPGVMLTIKNNYDTVVPDGKGGFCSTKQGQGHGYGIANIKKCVNKYQGKYVASTENGFFETRIIFFDSLGTDSEDGVEA